MKENTSNETHYLFKQEKALYYHIDNRNRELIENYFGLWFVLKSNYGLVVVDFYDSSNF